MADFLIIFPTFCIFKLSKTKSDRVSGFTIFVCIRQRGLDPSGSGSTSLDCRNFFSLDCLNNKYIYTIIGRHFLPFFIVGIIFFFFSIAEKHLEESGVSTFTYHPPTLTWCLPSSNNEPKLELQNPGKLGTELLYCCGATPPPFDGLVFASPTF